MFGGGGVDDELIIDAPDTHGSDRSTPGDIRDHQGSGGSIDRQSIDWVLPVYRDGVQDDLDVIAQVFWKERAQGAVGQACNEDGDFRWSTFTTEERTGDTSTGIHAFLIINCEGEVIDPEANLRAHGGGSEDHRVAQADGDSTTRLTG